MSEHFEAYEDACDELKLTALIDEHNRAISEELELLKTLVQANGLTPEIRTKYSNLIEYFALTEDLSAEQMLANIDEKSNKLYLTQEGYWQDLFDGVIAFGIFGPLYTAMVQLDKHRTELIDELYIAARVFKNNKYDDILNVIKVKHLDNAETALPRIEGLKGIFEGIKAASKNIAGYDCSKLQDKLRMCGYTVNRSKNSVSGNDWDWTALKATISGGLVGAGAFALLFPVAGVLAVDIGIISGVITQLLVFFKKPIGYRGWTSKKLAQASTDLYNLITAANDITNIVKDMEAAAKEVKASGDPEKIVRAKKNAEFLGKCARIFSTQTLDLAHGLVLAGRIIAAN